MSYIRLISFCNVIISIITCTAYNISCSDSKQCVDTNIDCLPDEDCNILCSTNHPCSHSIVECPFSGRCHVRCDGTDSCSNTLFNGSQSIQLGIAGCTECDYACSDLSIYCPLNASKHSKSCWISGDWMCVDDDCNHKFIRRSPAKTNESDNSFIYIVLSSIAAFSLIIGCFAICKRKKKTADDNPILEERIRTKMIEGDL